MTSTHEIERPRRRLSMDPRNVERRRKGKTRLRTLDGLDQRTRSARRTRELVALWTKALGSKPSPVQAMAIQHAAATTVICEDAQARYLSGDTSITPEQITKLSNIATRAVNALNLPAAGERKRTGFELRPLK
jgi:hypothetical protein